MSMFNLIKNILPLVLLLTSCAKTLVPVKYSYECENIQGNSATDARMDSIIQPYKDSLTAIMSKKIITSDERLTKTQPENALGNVLVDALHRQANKCCDKKVDITVLNQGAIRVAELAPGEVTLGNIYEIMPFENRLVLLELNGHEVLQLLNVIAAFGGWPLSGVQFTINNKKATDIIIGDAPLEITKNYWIGISDYLANGGDNLSMLKNKKQIDSGKNIREAFIAEFSEMNREGKHLKAYPNNRIIKK